MKKFKKFIREELETEVFDYDTDEFISIVSPMFVILKEREDKKYYISFNIECEICLCIGIYYEFCYHFKNLVLHTTDDCFYERDTFGNIVSIMFGENAKTAHYENIKNLFDVDYKNVTFH